MDGMAGGSAGLLIATLIIAVLYFTFFSALPNLPRLCPIQMKALIAFSLYRQMLYPKDDAIKIMQLFCVAFPLELTSVGLQDDNGNYLIKCIIAV